MSREDREYYIDWLLVAYPFKSRSYFDSMTDQELLREFERTNKYV